MTAVEWIEQAQVLIERSVIHTELLTNVGKIENAMKCLNEAKELLKEKA